MNTTLNRASTWRSACRISLGLVLACAATLVGSAGCSDGDGVAGGAGGLGGFGGSAGSGGAGNGPPTGPIEALVFTHTAGFRHTSIADGTAWLGSLDAAEEINVTLTEDPTLFTDDGLAPFEVVAFVSTTGDVLNDAQQAAFERFIRSGKGYVGVHSASDTEFDWPWYQDLMGAWFSTHQMLQIVDGQVTQGGPFEFTVEDAEHPSTAFLEPTFLHDDEIYSFRRNPRWHANVLLTIDTSVLATLPTINDQPQMATVTGGDHPVAWYKEFEGGRSWYTNIGHEQGTWALDWFRQHVLEGIRWAARAPNQYSKVTITDDAANPLAMAATPAGDLYYIERTGEVKLWNANDGRVTAAGSVQVSLVGENGLLGIALDPDFANNGWIYLYYAQAETRENVLARFDTNAVGSLIGLSERILLRVPSDREVNHEGGALEFAPDGTLFLSTGDNTIPFEADGYAPLDERAGRDLFNSQRTAANPFDLRGKILRINADGSAPAGNLFDQAGVNGRPEVYVMGTRNPFRIAVDPGSGRLFWGDVGPDASADGAPGPRGYDEINVADSPGNYGWPFCIADNIPYNDVDFETGTVGAPFSCMDVVPAAVFYDYDTVFHKELGLRQNVAQGRTAIAGTYYPTQQSSATEALPSRLQDTLLMTEWTRDLVVAVDFSEAGDFESMRGVVPWERFIRPVDLEVGPNGELFVLEFGSQFFGNNRDARVSRIEYSETGALRPTAVLQASTTTGPTPLTVSFSAEDSFAPGARASVTGYAWDVDGDGNTDSTAETFEHTYDAPGVYSATLTVEDSRGRQSFAFERVIRAGNTPPTLVIENPNGTPLLSGTTVPSATTLDLQVDARDVEDEMVPCDEVTWTLRLGHDGHSHPTGMPQSGCNFSFDTTLPEHGEEDDPVLFWAIEAAYTDQGGAGGEAPLTGRAGVRINVN